MDNKTANRRTEQEWGWDQKMIMWLTRKELDQRKIRNQYGQILIWETEGQDRIQMEIDGKMWKTSENVGNIGIGLGANITTERTENVRKCRKTTENVGNVGIGTGGNMVHDRT